MLAACIQQATPMTDQGQTTLSSATATPAAEVVQSVSVTEVPSNEELQEKVVKLDATPRILVGSAFAAEWFLLLEAAELEGEPITIAGTEYYIGTLAGNDVILYLSGVSMVNAAMTTQAAIDHFTVERIVFSGIAGGVNPNLNIGDVTVPAEWGQYLESRFSREVESGVFAASDDQEFPNFGMIFPSSVAVPVGGGEREEKFWFSADPEMLAVAQSVVDDVEFANCTVDNVCLDSDRIPAVKIGGRGVSGQTFVDNAAFRTYVWETFQADALDMETAAVAHVAYANGIPYIAFRSLSDLAGGGPGENEIGTYFQFAADNAALFDLAFLEAWASGVRTESDGEFVFGMVLVGPKNDHGWSQAHYEGGLFVEEHMPGASMVVFESLNPADKPEATLEGVVDDMVATGVSLVFTTSDEFEEDTTAVAKKYPDVVFINISGDDAKTGEAPPNLGNSMGRMEDMKAIAGCSAALATNIGSIGYLGPLINFETRRLVAAAYLGAQYCYEHYRGFNPDELQFTVNWIGFWFNIPGVTLDPTEVVTNFFDTGTDVVMSGIDTTEAIDIAGQRAVQGDAVMAIPYDYLAACDVAPEVCLGVPFFNWGPSYLQTAQAVAADRWTQSWDWLLADWGALGDVSMTHVGWVDGPALAAEQASHLAMFRDGLADGSINVWAGPINLQDGTPYIADGAVATDDEIWYLPQLLEGMTGSSN